MAESSLNVSDVEALRAVAKLTGELSLQLAEVESKVREGSPLSERDKLILKLLPLVKTVAGRVHQQLPVGVSFDDLVHAGVLGLFSALAHFDPVADLARFDAASKARLESFAEAKIRDAVLQYVRGWALLHQSAPSASVDDVGGATPQRFQEILSFRFIAAFKNGRPTARISYSDYCEYSAQRRHYDAERFRLQMCKLHQPHFDSGYLKSVDFLATKDGEGRPDWMMVYTPGPMARSEYQTWSRRQAPFFEQPETVSNETTGLLREPMDPGRIAVSELTEFKDNLLAERAPLLKAKFSQGLTAPERDRLMELEQQLEGIEMAEADVLDHGYEQSSMGRIEAALERLESSIKAIKPGPRNTT